MASTVPPPAYDDRWQGETIPETSPPGGDAWSEQDIESLLFDAMAVLDKSYPDAEDLLDEYTPGQLRTLPDRRVQNSEHR